MFSQQMEKMQVKGELDEEQLKALEMDMTGKVTPFHVDRETRMLKIYRSCLRHGEALDSRSLRFFERYAVG
jgi:hypothetical protein